MRKIAPSDIVFDIVIVIDIEATAKDNFSNTNVMRLGQNRWPTEALSEILKDDDIKYNIFFKFENLKFNIFLKINQKIN